MSRNTKQDAVKAAMSIANDVTSGALDPDDLQAAAVAEVRKLFGTVIGPEDPLWPIHVQVMRDVLAVGKGCISADELAEWSAVYRAAEGPPPSWIEEALAAGAGDDEDVPMSDDPEVTPVT
ncbi:flagellar hook-length control protein [Mycobacterium sp. CVI_P3]|uniref:Flagellar hook-length control protein n=1 Tax=Mycobacterium pinniadriaticum TaxID=2994102 RepID=A0ABT3SLQ8_9MYCO|nr:flagellar hook-length control protein [Mycobacterium pinniadriaticum]MCX2934046.1 flagellar hook-length control protein [Mycobacterium pinniadriaticum]MCX2940457.1 flagellar hook-length control protein [Mycobacterium pinniadriaticum]